MEFIDVYPRDDRLLKNEPKSFQLRDYLVRVVLKNSYVNGVAIVNIYREGVLGKAFACNYDFVFGQPLMADQLMGDLKR